MWVHGHGGMCGCTGLLACRHVGELAQAHRRGVLMCRDVRCQARGCVGMLALGCIGMLAHGQMGVLASRYVTI